jgi:hypothetical protein
MAFKVIAVGTFADVSSFVLVPWMRQGHASATEGLLLEPLLDFFSASVGREDRVPEFYNLALLNGECKALDHSLAFPFKSGQIERLDEKQILI